MQGLVSCKKALAKQTVPLEFLRMRTTRSLEEDLISSWPGLVQGMNDPGFGVSPALG